MTFLYNFPTHSARATDPRTIGAKVNLVLPIFVRCNLTSLTCARVGAPSLLAILRRSDAADVQTVQLLEAWDQRATVDSPAACLYYPFLDRFWAGKFMGAALQDDLFKYYRQPLRA